jgi:hypothetical protein
MFGGFNLVRLLQKARGKNVGDRKLTISARGYRVFHREL